MPGRKPKTLLLLGGSSQQVIAIETAKKLGFHTVLCDYLPDNSGRLVADEFHLISTTDRDAVLDIGRAAQVDGVLAYASEPAVLTATYVAETLGLPTNPLASVETLSTKYLFRQHLAQHGFAYPRSVVFPADITRQKLQADIAGLTYALIIKPTDASGSKGVTRIDDESGLDVALEHAARMSRNGVLIAEEYLESAFPYIIGGDIFVIDGEIRFWGLMSCLRDQGSSGLIPVGKKMPSGLSSCQLEIVQETLQRLIGSLSINFGEFNVELIVGTDNTIYPLEVAARAGGNMIPLELSDISGIDLVAANVLYAMGEDPGDISFTGSDKCFATYVLHTNTGGIIKAISLADELAAYLYCEVLYQSVGDEVEAFDGADKAVGILFFCFEDKACMDKMLAHIDELVCVIVEPTKRVFDIDNNETCRLG